MIKRTIGKVTFSLGCIVWLIAGLLNVIIGISVVGGTFGTLGILVGILLLPGLMILYPFVAWLWEGETVYFIIELIIWGVAFLAQVIAALGAHLNED
ncbi:MAG: hypothetical protein HOC20_04860 [Chloroflexi bacterium]|jgi:hypothetical protein|nr:hypothetical protein [Chloroflexota bacterium]